MKAKCVALALAMGVTASAGAVDIEVADIGKRQGFGQIGGVDTAGCDDGVIVVVQGQLVGAQLLARIVEINE